MGDDPKKIAARIISALKDIVAAKYSHPAHPDRPTSSRPTIHQEYFISLQKEAKSVKALLEQNAKPNSSLQETITGKLTKMKEGFDRYEQPFKAAGQTAQLTDLLMQVNAAVAYWRELVRELQKS